MFLETLPAGLPRTSALEQVKRWWASRRSRELDCRMTVLLVLVVGFLAGPIPFGVLSRKRRGVDIREKGSGNIGATNVARVLGVGAGVVVLVLDVAKGALPVWLAIGIYGGDADDRVAAGFAAILGHCFSPLLGGKGGKGVATALGVFLVLSPALAVRRDRRVRRRSLAITRVPALGSLAGIAAIAGLALASRRSATSRCSRSRRSACSSTRTARTSRSSASPATS